MHSDKHKWSRILWRNISWKGPLEVLLLNVDMTLNSNQVAQGFVGLKTGIRLLCPCWTNTVLPALLLSYVLQPLIILTCSADFFVCLSVFCNRETELDTLSQMQPHKCWMRSKNCFPWPAGSAPANGTGREGGICHHCCQLCSAPRLCSLELLSALWVSVCRAPSVFWWNAGRFLSKVFSICLSCSWVDAPLSSSGIIWKPAALIVQAVN